MSRPRRALVAAAVVLGLVGPGLVPTPPAAGEVRLVVEDARRGQVLLECAVEPGQRFTLGYLHSVSRTRVRGLFEVGPDGGLVIRETSFGTFGPGLPALGAGDRYEIRDGAIHQLGVDEPLPELSVFVQPDTEHVLEIGGAVLDLSRLLAPGALVRIRVESAVRPAVRPVDRQTGSPPPEGPFW